MLKIQTLVNSHPRQFGLDLVRTIAISLVLVSHFVKKLEILGFWGVELFFGLSGFLIGNILWRNFSQSNTWSIKDMINFWSRRWWRTLPSYYLFFIIFIFFHYWSVGSLPPIQRLSSFLWFGQELIQHRGEFYGVSWSLCVEEWFYLSFPIILWLLSKLKFNLKVCFLLSILAIFIFCSILRFLLIEESIRAITLTRLDAIGSGVLVAFYTSTTKISSLIRKYLFLAGLIILIGSILIPYSLHWSEHKIVNNLYSLILVPLGGALLLPYISLMRRPSKMLAPLVSCVEKLSLWSYSLYLSHIPILFIVYHLMGSFRDTTLGNMISKLIGLIISVLLSSLLFKYFETPLTKLRPHELKK